MIAALAGLLACDAERTLLEERSRPLGDVTVGEVTWSFVADLRRWRSSAGWTEDGGFTAGHETTVVAFRPTTPGGRVRGHPDHTWTFEDDAEAGAWFDGLTLESCAAGDRAAWRVGEAWRWIAPVGPGGVAALIERDAASCGEALAAFPSAEAWLTGAVAHPDACAHLTHLRRRQDAVACLLRQPADVLPSAPGRGQLPNAMNDPGFDDDLLSVLSDPRGDPTFAPYRVTALLPELGGDQRAALAVALRGRGRALVPWEVAALAALDPPSAAALALAAGTVEARLAAGALGLPATHAWQTPPPPRSPGWTAPWMPAGPPCPPTVRPAPERCP